MSIDLLLYVIAVILFGLAAFGIGGKINLVAVGLFCWVLTNII